jgi:hypothetical protein
MRNLGKNVRSKNVRVKHVRLLCKNVRQSSERVAGRFCYPSITPSLVRRLTSCSLLRGSHQAAIKCIKPICNRL